MSAVKKIDRSHMRFLRIMVPIEDGYQEFLRQCDLPQKEAYELLAEDFYDDYERLVITKFLELFEAIDSVNQS